MKTIDIQIINDDCIQITFKGGDLYGALDKYTSIMRRRYREIKNA
ncbi:hypothetical protein Ga0466249_005249 [Sporomusaceae bacterium BoRhaA]|nr:hypothetical protein [Pelorhabdus rhamnosifermentans]